MIVVALVLLLLFLVTGGFWVAKSVLWILALVVLLVLVVDLARGRW